VQEKIIPAGTTIDRYGGEEHGRFFAPLGTPYEARSLPYDRRTEPYFIYEVQKPLPVKACKTAAWFDEPGGGIQYETQEPAAQLKAEGMIRAE